MARLLAALLLIGPAAAIPASANCEGGPVASCKCLLGCEVFGAQPEKCEAGGDGSEVDVNKIVHDVVHKSLQSHFVAKPDCAGIKCIVGCAKQLDCLDQAVQGQCENVKEVEADCAVDCSGSPRGASPLLPVAALLVLAGGARFMGSSG
mmetsp:Transcript_57127/g.114498  ORF Transcript_57127/g.114498 Transcript_57127/m.114498 type:complete len:149 (-) Transcript_57127:319-765(-)